MGEKSERPKIYKSKAAVFRELQARGLKRSLRSITNDIKTGKLRREPGAGFLAEDVDRYAVSLSLRNAPGTPGGLDLDATDLAKEKMAAEVARLRNIVRKQELDYQKDIGKLCKSGDFYLALAERFSILRSRFNTMARVGALKYVKLSPDDFVDAITQDFAVILHEFSRPPEYDAEEVPDVFKGGADIVGKTEQQDKKHGDDDED